MILKIFVALSYGENPFSVASRDALKCELYPFWFHITAQPVLAFEVWVSRSEITDPPVRVSLETLVELVDKESALTLIISVPVGA